MSRIASVSLVFVHLLACGLAVAMCACAAADSTASAESDSVAVALDDTSYAPGDTAQVTVTNPGGRAVLFAFVCDAFIEGLVNAEWVIAFEPDCSAIRVRPTRLETGASAVLPLRIEARTPGDSRMYRAFRIRLRFQCDDSAGYRVAHSPPFHITPE
jgi:hypothetical protein